MHGGQGSTAHHGAGAGQARAGWYRAVHHAVHTGTSGQGQVFQHAPQAAQEVVVPLRVRLVDGETVNLATEVTEIIELLNCPFVFPG